MGGKGSPPMAEVGRTRSGAKLEKPTVGACKGVPGALSTLCPRFIQTSG